MEDQNYILFEKYLLKELSQNEIEAFEERLESDSDFNQSFATYQELSTFLGDKFENEEASNAFQENMKRISEEYFNKNEHKLNIGKTSKTFHLYKYLVAASVLLLFGIFTFNQFSNPLYSDFNDHSIISLTVRGNNTELLKVAEKAFNTRDFRILCY